jgi:hypothetical protein
MAEPLGELAQEPAARRLIFGSHASCGMRVSLYYQMWLRAKVRVFFFELAKAATCEGKEKASRMMSACKRANQKVGNARRDRGRPEQAVRALFIYTGGKNLCDASMPEQRYRSFRPTIRTLPEADASGSPSQKIALKKSWAPTYGRVLCGDFVVSFLSLTSLPLR